MRGCIVAPFLSFYDSYIRGGEKLLHAMLDFCGPPGALAGSRAMEFSAFSLSSPFYKRRHKFRAAVRAASFEPEGRNASQCSGRTRGNGETLVASMQLGIAVSWLQHSATHTHNEAWVAWLL